MSRKSASPVARLRRRLQNLQSRLSSEPCCHLISYPKCGRTWVRFMLARAITRHYGVAAGFELERSYKVHAALPRIVVTHDDDPHRLRPEEIETDKIRYANDAVILLVRDPRDVIVSMYLQRVKREKNFSGDLESFIRAREGGLDSLLRFYEVWGQHLDTPRALLLVRYEDVRTDPNRELLRMVTFLGMRDVAPEVLARAAEDSSFERMRELEREGRFASGRLRPGDPSDEESYKVRRGVVGGYTDYISGELLAQVNRRVERAVPLVFGYWYEQ